MNLLERWEALVAPFGFSPRFVRWSFVTAVSALLENRCYMLDHGGGYLYPTLYTLLVGAPSTYKTSTCDRIVDDALRPIASPIEGPFFGPSIATPAAMIDGFLRSNQANTLNNFKSSPLFVYAAEFNTFYRDIGGGEMTVDLLKFYDPLPPGVAYEKATVKDGRKSIISPALTILGCTTPKNIVDSKMLSVSGTGIVSRFIFVYEPRRPKGTSHRMSLRAHPDIEKVQTAFLGIRGLRGIFQLSEPAEALLSEKIAANNQWHQDNPADTLFAHYMARRGTQLKKLAMIHSALSRRTLIVEASDIEAADAMLRDIEPDMPHAYGAQILHKDSGLIQKLQDRISPAGVTLSQIMQSFRQDGQALPYDNDLMAALTGLEICGNISTTVDATTGLKIYKRTGK